MRREWSLLLERRVTRPQAMLENGWKISPDSTIVLDMTVKEIARDVVEHAAEDCSLQEPVDLLTKSACKKRF